ncbi:MAG: protein kinase, partial [Leptospiraceae bacterium]|nr:protein kinase [Leptospiraceae bacterium]
MKKELLGKRIGPYYVKEKLGEGGMGSVFLVEETTTKELYALKALPNTSPLAAESFKQEVEILKTYSHESIVKFITAGVDEFHE